MSAAHYIICDYTDAGWPLYPVCTAEVGSESLKGLPAVNATRKEAERRGWETKVLKVNGKNKTLDLCPTHKHLRVVREADDPIGKLRTIPDPSDDELLQVEAS